MDIVSQSKDHLEMLHWSHNILAQWFPKWAVVPLVDTPDEETEEKRTLVPFTRIWQPLVNYLSKPLFYFLALDQWFPTFLAPDTSFV